MQGKIAVGIVLFNPEDEKRVERSMKSILAQISKIYVFDNSTRKSNIIFQPNVTYLTEHGNKGIAYALNRILEIAKSDGYEWLITMDQDSVVPDGLITAFEEHFNYEQIGIICPQVIDFRRSYMEVKKELKEEYIDFCITSASCTRISAWESIGGFDEWMFIDLVDNDFCKRMIVSGFKILRLNELVLDQEFGRIIPKSKSVQKFWNRVAKILHNDNFGKLGYSKYVSPMRVYYTNRNIIYINRKLKNYGKTGYKENYNCSGYFGFLISFVLPSILRAKEKGKVIKAVALGMRDGLRAKPNRWIVGK
jgi:rhamnosyltransferase